MSIKIFVVPVSVEKLVDGEVVKEKVFQKKLENLSGQLEGYLKQSTVTLSDQLERHCEPFQAS